MFFPGKSLIWAGFKSLKVSGAGTRRFSPARGFGCARLKHAIQQPGESANWDLAIVRGLPQPLSNNPR
jgi:hypothetical protein